MALAVQRIVVRAILTDYRRRARKAGIVDGRAGAVCVIQRFGSALNLNPHFHLVVPGRVFAPDNDGALRFHP
ncbi:MAG: transposase [Sandaracinaceae bacterium]|nr:transposase [Sandaracinaceae bacterium]